MTPYIDKTEVWEIYPDGRRYLIHEISGTSKFFGFTVPKEIQQRQHEADAQLWIANELRSGWIMAGPNKDRTYEIWQRWLNADPSHVRVV